MVTVCDKCRKPMAKVNKVLGSELCDSCAKHIKEWIKKPSEKKDLLELGLDTMFGRNK